MQNFNFNDQEHSKNEVTVKLIRSIYMNGIQFWHTCLFPMKCQQ